MSQEYTTPVPDLDASEVPEPGAVTIVVPTFNESANIRELLHQITESVPARLPCEVVFVDDSTDDTPEVIKEAGDAGENARFIVDDHRQGVTGDRLGGRGAGIMRRVHVWARLRLICGRKSVRTGSSSSSTDTIQGSASAASRQAWKPAAFCTAST